MTNKSKMKRTLLSAGMVALIAAAGLTVSTPASADRLGVGITPYGFSLNFNTGRHFGRHNNYGYRQPYYGQRHNNRRRFNRRHVTNNYYNNNNYNTYQSGPMYTNQGCQPVSKSGYWNGRQAKVGGTMCYDAYGNSYVVQGSRYLIHYY